MRFSFTQRFAADVDDVSAALCDPGYLAIVAESPKLGAPEVLSREQVGDQVTMRARYRFVGDLSSAVRAVLDPDRITWVEESVHDLAGHTVRFRLAPDHYPDRLQASGTYRLTPAPDDAGATIRVAEGELKVRAPLVAGTVERAIVSGLGEHLDQEPARLVRWLAGS